MKDLDKVFAENIANEYSEKKDSKVVALKKLDKKAKMPSLVFGYTFGSIMSLVLGVGMCLCMGVLGSGTISFVLGIVIGIIGIAGVTVNPVIYNKMLEKGKKKYAYEIIELAKEIAND
ncbi:MAG: dihydropteridine reductase [Clostridia bacterium]|nr:dihydropteridine reductase [Clostridia bacterium]